MVLSACAWATARALDLGPAAADWLDGFTDLEAAFAVELEEACLGGEDGCSSAVVTTPPTRAHLLGPLKHDCVDTGGAK